MIRGIPAFLVVLAATSPVSAGETFNGPVAASVVAVVDGDTLEVSARIWLGIDIATRVRIRGIDTPELHSRCAQEKAMAEAARARLVSLAGDNVRLTNIANDKYGGRVDADVATAAGADLAAAMIATGLARRYDGKGERADWCPVASVPD
jgi:endonuclease YncB( thermonuclease family)